MKDSFGVPLPMSPRKTQARMKLLRIIPRKDLEQMSNRQQPWHSDRRTLEIEILNAWPGDEIETAIGKILSVAKGAV